ncbi:sulfotransferase family 2 domain-containing protein [Desulfurivibrio dismutans]|uniref:sulfotransferase family 2 domain-containing protein n=1 Tax=Desulfurivibrio dismutans TaxID=1398908 RepID=UPI0023DC2BB5|nr:sulfotransferase family 2 domain-containing protein [Desulfurivibrio alkaliphilus]MDF1614764.1 sulfotransferase family 2 domain-containing protein [Desulfurivibrio alkaliphilus]
MHLSRRLSELFNPLLNSLDGRVQRHRVNSRILVSEANRFVFYRIPKAGHSTVGKTLVHYDPHLSAEERQGIEISGSKSGPYLHPRELGRRRAQVAWREYFKLTFVRNPYRRVLSAYLDKITRNKPATKNLKTSPTDEHGQPLTFLDFLAQIKGVALYEGPHWAPQVALLPRDRSRLDFIGHLEKIDTDLAKVVQRVYGRQMADGVKSWDDHKTKSGDDFHRYYDGPAIDAVRSLYREDFAAFGYSSDPEAALR